MGWPTMTALTHMPCKDIQYVFDSGNHPLVCSLQGNEDTPASSNHRTTVVQLSVGGAASGLHLWGNCLYGKFTHSRLAVEI